MNHKIDLTSEELLCIAQNIEQNLQIAIDNDIPRRISFYQNMRNKIQIAINGPVLSGQSRGLIILWSQVQILLLHTKIIQPTI